MGNYAYFTFATLVLFTLTNFTAAAEYVVPVDLLSVRQVNTYFLELIPTTVDVNSSAKSWLIQQNLWDFLSPHLNQEHASSLNVIFNGLTDIEADYRENRTKDILGEEKWAHLSPHLREMQVGDEIIDKDLLTVEQTLRQLVTILDLRDYALIALNDCPNDTIENSLLSDIDLWSVVVQDYLIPLTLEVNDLTAEQKRYFL